MGVAGCQGPPDRLVLSQKVPGGEDQIIEVQDGGGALVGPEPINKRADLTDEVLQDAAGCVRAHRSPGLTTGGMMAFGLLVEALPFVPRQARVLRRLAPL